MNMKSTDLDLAEYQAALSTAFQLLKQDLSSTEKEVDATMPNGQSRLSLLNVVISN